MEKSESKRKNEIDMLNGSLLDKILLFALPLAMSSILQQLFNSVDVAVVGHFVGSKAQAAVGCNAPVINLMINIFLGISVGANVVIANYIGKQKKEEIVKSVHTTMLIAIISGVILFVIGIAFANPILKIMDTPSNILDESILYLKIYFIGMPFIMIYNFGAAVLRSIGDTKRSLYSLILAGVVNVVLNLILVIGFHLGISGVAIATVVSNVISAGMIWHFLSHENSDIQLSYKKLSISKNELSNILKIGIPAGLQGLVFSFSNVCIQTAINGYGSDAVAGSSVALNYEYVAYFIIASFNQAAVTFTSQNFGAGNYDRCKKVFRICMLLGMAITGCTSLIFVTNRVFFASLFTSDAEVIKYATQRMIYILTLNFIANSYEVGGSALRGIGYSMTPAMLTVFGTCVFRLFWVYIVCPRYTGFTNLMIVYPISWVITGTSVLAVYFVIRKRVFSNLETCIKNQ